MTFRLLDIFLFLWLLFSWISGLFKGVVEIKFLLVLSLISTCYVVGRGVTDLELLKKVTQFLIVIIAAICCYYLYADITIFQQHTFVSQNSSMLAIQIAILASLTIFILSQAQSQRLKAVWVFCVVIFLFLLMILQSRTAIIALIAGLLYFFYPRLRSWYSQMRIVFIAISILTLITFVLAVFVKIDSSQGRWFIWQNSFQLFKSNWITGTGVGLFNPSYNHLQADYFAKHSITDKAAMLANDGYFAFNEWLHTAVEQGIFGLIFFLLITVSVLHTSFKNIENEKSFAGAILILVVAASLFSYPLHNWLLLSVAVFLTGMISRQTRLIGKLKAPSRMAVAGFIVLPAVLIFTGFRWFSAISTFGKAKALHEEGYKTEAYNLAHQNKGTLKTHPAFTLFYLNLLHETGRLNEAIEWGNYFHKYHCNQKAHALLAKCYAETGNFEKAEQHFYNSLYITPHLLQSRMDFVDFYNQRKDIVKAKYWATLLLDCPVKIPTDKAWFLKEKAAEYLKTH